MSEPRRWKDSPDAPIGMRELLGSAPRSRPLDEAAFRRGARRVAAFSVAPAAAVAASFWTKLAAAGALGLATAGAIAGAATLTHEPPATEQRESSRAPVASARVEMPAPIPAPEPLPSPSEPVRAAAPVGVARVVPAARPVLVAPPSNPTPPAEAAADVPPDRPKSTLADELELLQSAREHLAQRPETTLAELDKHRALYPTGTLGAERDLLELDALRRCGRVQDAKSRAQDWLARDPRGIHAARVRQILATLE